MKESLIILFCFCTGILCGREKIFPFCAADIDTVAMWIVYVMLAAVGMTLGFDVSAWRILRELKGFVLVVPLIIILGTALGALGAWLILDMNLRDVLAVAAGFGYYSLSSMLITHEADASLGSMALIANMTRELLALLLAPIFAKVVGGLGPLSAAGAASDTCLSVILQTSGERNAVIAIFSGMLLTVLVPIFIPLIFALL